jgi:transcription initiation factor TFIIB
MNQLETVISARDGRTGLSRDLQRASARGAAQRSNGQTSTARLEAVFTKIKEQCNLLGLEGQVVQGAQHAFIIVNEQREVKPKSERVYIAACISFASRTQGGAARSLMEISSALNVTKKVSRSF